ncbi:YncE family protein [Lichenicoccus sp.]|uniref:YncE family protein n=1 Tax=Lichenicoccus sp. TaxID=2781899 RepID=UPI003D0B0866
MIRYAIISSAVLGLSLAPLNTAKSEPPATYHITNILPVPGEGLWDYLTFDQSHRRLFVTRVGGVDVFDASGSVLASAGSIPGGPGVLVNRAVPVESRDLGFTSNGPADSTTLFRLSDLKVKGVFPLGEATDAAVYDEETRHAVFFSAAGQDALVFDPRSRTVIDHIPLGSAPEFAVDDHEGTIYVNLPATGKVARIDARTDRVVAQYTVDPSCHANSSIDIDQADHLLFVGCFSGELDVINQRTGRTVSTFPTGPLPDSVEYDPGTRTVFASTVDGKITAVEVDSSIHQELLQVATTQPGTHSLTIDLRTHRIFTDTADAGPTGPDGLPFIIRGTFRVLTVAP